MRDRRRFAIAVLLAAALPAVADAAHHRAARSPVPFTVTAIFPSSATVSGASFALAIYGTGFSPDVVVRWNNTNRQTWIISETHIEASIAAADISTAGTARVIVFDPRSGTSSNEMPFRIVNGIAVNVSPPIVDVVRNGTQKFDALLTGTTDTFVLWSATAGAIGSDGVFTAPPAPGQAVIRATSLADRGAYGEATVNVIAPPPVISGLSPSEANAGEEISINGSGFYQYATRVTVFFSGADSTVIPSSGFVNSPTRISAVVPLGASSGPLRVDLQSGLTSISSNSVQFNRTPRLLIRSSKRDLSSGESVRLDLRFLGDPQNRPVVWTADRGTVTADGVYRAPIVTSETLDRVHVCLPSSSVCSTRLLGIHPLRIDPAVPIVPMGQALRLSAIQGDAPVAATWSLQWPLGTLSQDGTFAAATTVSDGGGIPVAATYGDATATSSIAVTGAIPGILNRIRDYADTAASQGVQGTWTYAVASSGHLAYVLSISAPIQHWLDVYDISDPVSPAWLDSAEAVYPADSFPALGNFSSPPTIFAYDNSLFMISPVVGGATNSVPLAVFNVVDNRIRLDTVTTSPFAPSYGPFGFQVNAPTLYVITQSQLGMLNAFRFEITGRDPRRPVIANLVHFPIPDLSLDPSNFGPVVGSGNRAYAVSERLFGVNIVASLYVYDVSTDPALLLETVDLHSGGLSARSVKIAGKRMFVGKELFDISGSLPTLLGALPLDTSVLDFNASWAVARTDQTGFQVFDIRDVTRMKLHASLFDGNIGRILPALAGDRLLSVNGNGGFGGLTIYDIAPAGGPRTKSRLYGGGGAAVVFDQRIDGNRLIWAEENVLGPAVNFFDVEASPPTALGTFSEKGNTPLSIQPLGNVLYVGNTKSLTVLDVANPSTPTKITELAFPVSCLALSGTRLFAGTTDNRLVVIDASVPFNPVQLASVPLSGFPVQIKVAGSLAFIAADTAGLLIYDLTQPVPALRSRTNPFTYVEDVEVDGNLALLAAVEGGFVIENVSDAAHPVLVSQMRLRRLGMRDGLAVSVGIKDKIAYVGLSGAPTVGQGNGAVYGFDYRVADHPRLVSLAAYGTQLEAVEVDNFSFRGTDAFIGGVLSPSIFQLDNTQPRNVLNLDYPSEVFERPLGMATIGVEARQPAWIHPKIRAAGQ